MRIRIFGQYCNLAFAFLWVAEIAVLLGSSWLAYLLRGHAPAGFEAWLQPITFTAFGTLGLIAMGSYSPRQRDRVPLVMLRVALALGLSSAAALVCAFIVRDGHFFARAQLVAAGLSWLGVVFLRVGVKGVIPEDVFKRRVLVYGSAQRAVSISRLRRRADRRGFTVVGYLAVDGEDRKVPEEQIVPCRGTILQTAVSHDVDEIIVAMDDRRQKFPSQQLLECRLNGIDVVELITFLERETGKLHIDVLNSGWLVFSSGFRHHAFRRLSERAFDLLASLTLLALFWPIMVLVALAIKLEEGWRAPVFYSQSRVGYGGATFELIKFRSMRTNAEHDGKAVWASVNDQRVTRVGGIIRKLRFDELPQLLTVLRGKMSFVGPRPERPEFVEQLEARIPFYRERHFVKPGLTGWAQLCYPYGASEQDALEKLQYDLYYVKNHGLLFDFLILLQTAEIILLGRGAR